MGVINLLLPISILMIALWVGKSTLKLLSLTFGKGEIVLVAPAVGLVILAELTRWGAYATKRIDFLTIGVAVVLAVVVAVFVRRNKVSPDETDVTRSRSFWLVLLAIGGYITVVLWTRVLHPGNNGELMIGPPMLYGDTPVHVEYATKLAYGAFPPDNPIFAGTPLVYPNMIHLVYAIFLNLGLSIRLALFLPQLFFTIAFLTLFVKLVREFTGSLGVIVAAINLFLGWGLGFVFFFREWQKGVSFLEFSARVGDLTHNDTYAMQMANVLTGVILPGRTILPGLVIGLLLSHMLLKERRLTRRLVIVTGLGLGILPLWHTHTFIFFAVAVAWWFLFWTKEKVGVKLKYLLLCGAGAFIVAFPSLLPILTRVSQSSLIELTAGWMMKGENFVTFWFRNSFLLIPLTIAGFVVFPRDKRIFFIPSFIVFAVANLVSFQPLGWDNIKLLAWVILFWSILVGCLFEWLRQKQKCVFAVGLGLLVLGSISGVLSLRIPLESEYILYDREGLELAEWAKLHTSPEEIFLTEPIHNHPLPGLAGRSIYLGYPGTLWTYGINYAEREQQLKQVFSGKVELIQTMAPRVSYLVVTSWQNQLQEPHGYPLVYQNQKYRVYRIE